MNEASFWIRVFDLPLMAQNEYIGNLVGEAIGRVEEVDINYRDVEWREYMCVRICIDITKPLLRKNKMNLGLAELVWVNFTYKRLLDLSFCYVKLGHSHKECSLWDSMKKCELEVFFYGNWMKEGPKRGGGNLTTQLRMTRTYNDKH